MEKGSSSSSSSGAGADSINGLKFGKKIYFEGVGSGLRPKNGSGLLPEAAPPPSPAKKGRTGLVQEASRLGARWRVVSPQGSLLQALSKGFANSAAGFINCPNLTKENGVAADALPATTSVGGSHSQDLYYPPAMEVFLRPHLLRLLNRDLVSWLADNHSKSGGFVMDFSAYSSSLTGRDSWTNTNATSERGSGNQATIGGKYQLPWQSSLQTPLPDLLQGSPTRPSYTGLGVSSDECFSGVSDTSSALSLLSNQPWGSTSQSLSLGVNSFLGPDGTAIVQPSASSSWGFKGNQASNTLQEMPPDMGIAQISQYSGDLGLGQPNDGQYREIEPSRGYDSSVQHMHWSL
ncbi:UNVERIFIED_CONTAM: hypothetical protein Slati_3033900 [Sesamum latifolium]|uniref:Growth-regulating factor n=1 Tax=Sesamum latifolium TaxID=2727402 RepID=A0AAW2VLC1_9LAMI